MPSISSRRQLLATALALPAIGLPSWLRAAAAAPSPEQALAALEARHGGRVGVLVHDLASGRRLGRRSGERFRLCSTFKWLLAAQVLAAVDAGRESLDRRLAWTQDELIAWSPVTEKHVAEGLSVGELCAATLTTSDNTAANVLLAAHGGPAGLTAWLRGIGDTVTRLDRIEPQLNGGDPGDPRDTSTPDAMADTMQRVLLGDVLAPASRAQLVDWLLANTTGDARLRAGLPGWRVGDKTGSDGRHTSNDIAIAWPPGGGGPVLIAAFVTESTGSGAQRDAVLADIGALAAAWAGG